MEDKKNLQGAKAVEFLRENISGGDVGVLCTNVGSFPVHAVPMSTNDVDDRGRIWFLSGKDSDHNAHITADSRVQVMYLQPDTSAYIMLSGRAHIKTDRTTIEEKWSPFAKIWFPEGKEDPNLTVICFEPSQGHYWDSKNGQLVSYIKMGVSLLTGKHMDDSVTGDLQL